MLKVSINPCFLFLRMDYVACKADCSAVGRSELLVICRLVTMAAVILAASPLDVFVLAPG